MRTWPCAWETAMVWTWSPGLGVSGRSNGRPPATTWVLWIWSSILEEHDDALERWQGYIRDLQVQEHRVQPTGGVKRPLGDLAFCQGPWGTWLYAGETAIAYSCSPGSEVSGWSNGRRQATTGGLDTSSGLTLSTKNCWHQKSILNQMLNLSRIW